jgi:hypothetical protein
MDCGICLVSQTAAMFGVTVSSGFGCDFAAVVDEVGACAEGFVLICQQYWGCLGCNRVWCSYFGK